MSKIIAMSEFILPAAELDVLIQLLRTQYRVLGPTVAEQAIVYGDLASAADLPQGWTDVQEKGHYRVQRRDDQAYFGFNVGPQSWKQFLQPPKRLLWQAERSEQLLQFKEPVDTGQPMALIGVRSCELRALAILDKVYCEGDTVDSFYAQRRRRLFTVAVNCITAAPTCFCVSMNGSPQVSEPADLVMTELIDNDRHCFLISAQSGAGHRILQQLPVTPAADNERKAAQAGIERAKEQMQNGPRAFDSSDLQQLLYQNVDSPVWDDIAQRCLSCANCTMACPTCFCSSVEDTTDLSGQHAERWQRWDSCFNADFSYLHSGPVRQTTASRYRQWMTHKLASWHDQFDTSGCVGCGRCISWCPVGIDITENISALRGEQS